MFKFAWKTYNWYSNILLRIALIKLSLIVWGLLSLYFFIKIDSLRDWTNGDDINELSDVCYVAVNGPKFVSFQSLGGNVPYKFTSPDERLTAQMGRTHWVGKQGKFKTEVHYYYGWLRSATFLYRVDEGKVKPLSCERSGGLIDFALALLLGALSFFFGLKALVTLWRKCFPKKRIIHPKDKQEKNPHKK